MKKYTLIILVFISLSAKSQVVNRFRDSTWFAKSVRFDSAIYLIKGASNGKVLTSDAYGRATWQSASGGVSQSALDDSINSVRSIRKVDTLYKNLDSIIYKINGIRYSIKDSSGGLTDSTIFATKNYVNSLNGSNATITSLNDSITSVRNIRKVDTLYRNLDSIIYKINSIRYAIKDSTGGGADSQSLHLAFSDSIELSITRGNSIKFAYAIDSVSLITDSLIVFKGGVRKSYVKNTVSFVKNTSKDSIILTLNGNRYAVKDSIGSGGSSLSGLTAATATNTINNLNYKQRWNWNTIAGDTALVIASNSVNATSNLHSLLAVAQSGANANSSQTTYGALISNTKTGTSSNNIGLQITSTGGTTNIPLKAYGDNEIAYFNASTGGTPNLSFNINDVRKSRIGHLNLTSNEDILYLYTATASSSIRFGINNTFVADLNGNGIGIGVFPSYPIHTTVVGINDIAIYAGTGRIWNAGTSDFAFSHYRGSNFGYMAVNSSGRLTIGCHPTGVFKQIVLDGTYDNVGMGTLTPTASAKLELSSTTQGFLPPRMTARQASAIASPAKSLIVYVTDTNGTFTSAGIWIFTTSWKLILAE